MRTLAFLLLFVVLASAPAAGQAPAADTEQTDEQFKKLIADLASGDFHVREAATQQLTELAESAREAVEAATRSPDLEQAFRAQQILGILPTHTHVVVDAIGQPIPLAAVRVLIKDATGEVRQGGSPRRTFTDRRGLVALPEAMGKIPERVLIELRHPDYGIATCSPLQSSPGDELPVCRLPLVRAGTEARQRAVSGRVLDADGKPLPGVVIRCQNVRTQGEGLINAEYPLGEVLTDERGAFALYMPAQKSRGPQSERGELIPPGSRYNLYISTTVTDCFPVEGMFSNREPLDIRLPRANRFHRFRFVKPDGSEITSVAELRNVTVMHQGGADARVRLTERDIRDGRTLIPGTYIATNHNSEGRALQFSPLVVKADSPEVLTFELPPTVVIRGRALHGITGKPLADAWVLAYTSTSRNNLALLTADDWKTLRAMSPVANEGDEAMKLLSKFYGTDALVRTGAEGRFEIVQPPTRKSYGIIAFAVDFLPLEFHLHSLKPGADAAIEVGELPLFPAAKLQVRPVIAAGRASVAPEWMPEKDGQPEWFDKFRAATSDSRRRFGYVNWLALNAEQPVYIPSGVRLKVMFHTPYEDQFAPAMTGVLEAKQGEVLAGGELRFGESIAVSVRVVGADGKPLEGIPVRRMQEGTNAWSVAHNTSAEGVAQFYVHPNSHGRFWTSDLKGAANVRQAANLYASFDVADKPLATPYVITLTDAQVKLYQSVKP